MHHHPSVFAMPKLRLSLLLPLSCLWAIPTHERVMHTEAPFEGILDLMNWRTRNSGVWLASLEQPRNTPKDIC